MEWTQNPGTDGYGHYTTLHPDNNYPSGGGGSGMRQWLGTVKNSSSPGMFANFWFSGASPQRLEMVLNVRWWTRYQEGLDFTAGSQNGHKALYFAITSTGTDSMDFEASNGYFRLTNGAIDVISSGYGLNSMWGGTVGDGQWHCYEVYYKTETSAGAGNAEAKIWIDGVLRASQIGGFNTGSVGVPGFTIPANNHEVANPTGAYIDVDDLKITNDGVQIGCTVGGGGGDSTPPSSVSITDPTAAQTITTATYTVHVSCADNSGQCDHATVQYGSSTPNTTACTVASFSGGTGTCSWTVPANATYNLNAIGYDPTGNNTTSATISGVVINVSGGDTTPPSIVAMISPFVPTQVKTQRLLLMASCTDNTGADHMVYKYGTSSPATTIGTASVSNGNTWPLVWTTPAAGAYVVAATCFDAAGNNTASSNVAITVIKPTIYFTEGFEDSNLSARGWYDGPSGTIDSAEHAVGAASFRCTYNSGSPNCAGGAPARHLFTETTYLYFSAWVKYSANYVGTGTSSGPHEFYILTNKDGAFEGLSYNKLDLYIQQTIGTDGDGIPAIQIQDAMMIDEANINIDLAGTTENRAVSSCNGVANTGAATFNGVFGRGNCYVSDSPNPGNHWNQFLWLADNTYFRKAAGDFYLNDWHLIEVFARLNTISGGIGQQDGLIQYWYDGRLAINVTNAIMRTGANADMAFNQLIIGPYLGSASSVTQSFWIDDLAIGFFPSGRMYTTRTPVARTPTGRNKTSRTYP